jgi:integrase
MSVRKHRGKWLVTLTTPDGKKSYKTFNRRKDAAKHDREKGVAVDKGEFTHDRDSPMISQAASDWLKACGEDGLERSTIDRYRQYANLHIVPLIGAVKLNELSLPMLRQFQGELREAAKRNKRVRRPEAIVKGATTALCGIISQAMDDGLVNRNIVKERSRRKTNRGASAERNKPQLEVGKDIPTPAEIEALMTALHKPRFIKWRPLIMVAAFTGLRASELRGLRWCDLDLQKGLLNVRQRADRYNEIGSPKSGKSARRIPLPDAVKKELLEHKLRSNFKKPDDLVFANGAGNVESLANIRNRGLVPAWREAGVTDRYEGMHSLRHWFASWCANRKEDGGLGLPMKVVQERMGHSSILITADRYSHLFPVEAADQELSDSAARLIKADGASSQSA